MEGKRIRVLTVKYNEKIQPYEVPLFRGAVIGSMADKANTLYHNHLDDKKYRYSYPLIQYKTIGGNAAIVCVGDGADVIGQFMAEDVSTFKLGDKTIEMTIDDIKPRQMMVQTWSSVFYYSIKRWLPLNSINYKRYQECDSLVERTQMLQQILKGNILSFAKGIGLAITEEVKVDITRLDEPFLVKRKGTSLMAFNMEFNANFSLPNFIGLGKNASIGFGVVYENRKRTKEQNIANQ